MNEVSDPDDRLDDAQLFLGEPDLLSIPIRDQRCICSRMKAEPLSMLIESIAAAGLDPLTCCQSCGASERACSASYFQAR